MLVLVAAASVLLLSGGYWAGPVPFENNSLLWKTWLKLAPKETGMKGQGPAPCKANLTARTEFSLPKIKPFNWTPG